MKIKFAFLTGSILATLTLSGPAFAQDQQQTQIGAQQNVQRLDEQAVRDFVQQMEQDITSIRRGGDASELQQWTRNNVSDAAVFSSQQVVTRQGQPKVNITANFTKQELLALGRVAMSDTHDMSNMLQNYNLQIRVTNVRSLGDRAAVVETEIDQSGTLAPGQQQGVQTSSAQDQQNGTASNEQGDPTGSTDQAAGSDQNQQGQAQQASGQLNFQSQANCTYLLTLDEGGGQVQIGMANCAGTTSL